MKRLLLLCIYLTAFTLTEYAQEFDNISNVPPIKKGKIILIDGTMINFKKLSVSSDSVSFTGSQSVIYKYHQKDIYKLSKIGNYALAGALSGGIGGLIGAALGSSDWDNNPDLKDMKSTYIVGAALVSTLIGGIVGACIKKDKIVYKSSKPISFDPQFNFLDENKPVFLITCKININSK